MCIIHSSFLNHIYSIFVGLLILLKAPLIIIEVILIIHQGHPLTPTLFVCTGLYAFLCAFLITSEGLFKIIAIIFGIIVELIFLILFLSFPGAVDFTGSWADLEHRLYLVSIHEIDFFC